MPYIDTAGGIAAAAAANTVAAAVATAANTVAAVMATAANTVVRRLAVLFFATICRRASRHACHVVHLDHCGDLPVSHVDVLGST